MIVLEFFVSGWGIFDIFDWRLFLLPGEFLKLDVQLYPPARTPFHFPLPLVVFTLMAMGALPLYQIWSNRRQ